MRRFTTIILLIFPLFCFAQKPGIFGAEEKSIIYSKLIENYPSNKFQDLSLSPAPASNVVTAAVADCDDAFIPVDTSTYTAMPRSDDGSEFVDLGFEFTFCDTSYTSCWINTNGNLSFHDAVQQWFNDGFPTDFPIIAPFWGDVDTRNPACGQIWYRLFPNYLIVTWDEVGFYNYACNPLNSFQVIISDGTAPIIGVGNNIQFRYADMGWATGQDSGQAPFNGLPSTVGYNTGDSITFEQIGLFNQDNDNYDGPFGDTDGLHYLDYNCFVFSTGAGEIDLTCTDIQLSLTDSCVVSITPEDLVSFSFDGCGPVDLSIDISDFSCEHLGDNPVTVTATSGNITETCIAIVTITQGLCPSNSIDPVASFCESDAEITLTTTTPGGTWGPNTPNGVFDPSIGPGTYTATYSHPNACPETATLDIEVFASPVVSISPDETQFCEDQDSLPIVATATQGDGFYTFTWDTPMGALNGDSIYAVLAGTYTVTVFDGFGCQDSASTTVIVNPSPDVQITDPGVLCESETLITLEATPTAGTWEGTIINPQGEINPNQEGVGSYTVTYTYLDSLGCTGVDSQLVNIIPTPTAIPSNGGPYCLNDPIELFGDTDIAGGDTTYLWTGPNAYTSNLQNPTDATEAGIYVLQVTVDGCVSETDFTEVVITPAPDATAGNGGPYCPGSPIELFGSTTSNDSILSYAWTGPGGYQSTEQNPVDATLAGTYNLIVTAGGCPSVTVATIVSFTAQPEAIASNDGPFCAGETFALEGDVFPAGTTVMYSWTGPGGYQSIEQNPDDATEPGIYELIVEVDGCISTVDSTEVFVNPLIDPDITGNNVFCTGDSTTIDAGAGYSGYQWNVVGETNQTLVVTLAGTYFVTVTDANGCTGEGSININVNQNPQPSIAGSTTFCSGGSTTLDAGGSFDTYLWSTGDTTQTIVVNVSDTYSVIVTDSNGCTGTDNVSVTESSGLNPIISGDTIFCFGESTLLDAGAGFDTYNWTGNFATQTLVVTSAGVYTVTVSDASGCTGESSVTVTENPMLDVSITGNTTFCTGSSTLLEASSGFTAYLWSDSSLNQTLTVTTEGTYSVTVTDINGCTATDQVVVDESDSLNPNIMGDLEICEGEMSTLDAGAGYQSYQWSNSDTTQMTTVQTSGNYSVTVTDANNCTGESSVFVEVNDNPNVSIMGDDSFCEGESSILSADLGFDNYIWTGGDTTQTLSVNSAGAYGVTVTDENECTAEDQIQVTVFPNPEPVITGPNSFCPGSSTTLDGGAGYETYLWSNGLQTQMITVSTANNYCLTVTDSNGCTGDTCIIVTENSSLSPMISGELSFCEGASTLLDAGTGYDSYLWSNGDTTQLTEISIEGNISVTVTDANGCSGSTSVTTSINPDPEPMIGGSTSFCTGSSTTLDAGPGYLSYDWSTGDTTQTIEVFTEQLITLNVIDTNGCMGSAMVNITESTSLSPVITGDTAFCENGSTVLNAGSGFQTYLWSTTSDQQTITVDSAGTYSVTVSDSQGCTGEGMVQVVQLTNPEPVITGPNSFCPGSSTMLDGGAGYETYLWSNGLQTQTITVSTANTYCLTVTDSNGCAGDTCIMVTENSSLSPMISGELSFCEGASTLLDAGTGYDSYLWFNGDTTQLTEISIEGNISVTVTDANGCSGSTSASTSFYTDPEPMIGGSTSFCIGSSTTLDAGPGYLSYDWSTGDTTQTIEVFTEQLITLNVIDTNSCMGSAMVNITESTSLNPVITGDTAFCENGSTVLNAGSGFQTYLWSTSSDQQTITVNSAGTYSVTVSDSQGCTGEDEISITEVTPPGAELLSDTAVCNTSAGGSILNLYDLILAGDMNGTWMDVDNSGASGNFNNLDFDGVTPGAYEFIYTTNSATPPCSEVEYSVMINVANCDCPSVFLSQADPLCNSSETLDVSTLENTTEPGIWSIIQTPGGANPATLNGTLFDATGADSGNYVLQFELTNQPPDGCPTTFSTTIQVDQEVNAGQPQQAPDFCFDENESVNLEELITGEDAGGTWMETSAVPSTGGAFDAFNGTFGTSGQNPGVYSFEYLLASGNACPDQSTEVSVFINELPTLIIEQNNQLSCSNPVNTLDASGSSEGPDFTIAWTGPGIVADGNENSLTPSINQPGDYFLTITNNTTGCAASGQTEVITNDVFPTAFAGADDEITCNDSLVTLQAQGDIGTGYEIVWQGPDIDASNMNLISPEVSIPGTYILTINDETNGCSSLPDTVIIMDATTEPDVFIDTPLAEITCNEPAVDLDGGSSSPNVSFQWLDPNMAIISNSETATGITTEGTFTLIVTDNDNGCTASETAIITTNEDLPLAEAGLPGLINCSNDQVELDGTGSDEGSEISYSWSGPAGGIIGPDDELTVIASLPGTYTITVLDASNGCSASDTVLVNQDIQAPDIEIASPDQLDCSGTEVSLDGTGSTSGAGITYSWTNSDSIEISTMIQASVTAPGEYIFTVFDAGNGCSSTESVVVAYNSEVLTSALIEIYELDCHDDSDAAISIYQPIGGTPPYMYALNGAPLNENNFFTGLSAGTYELAIEDANGCFWDTSIVISNPPQLEIDLGPDIELDWADSLLIDAHINIPFNSIDTLIWTPAHLIDCTEGTICLEGIIHAFNTELLSATLVDINGCRATDQLMLTVVKDYPIYIPTAFSPNDDGDNDVFMIFADLENVVNVERFTVFNRWGGIVHEATNFLPNDPAYGWDGKLKGKPLNPGVFVYLAEIELIDGQIIMLKGDITLLK